MFVPIEIPKNHQNGRSPSAKASLSRLYVWVLRTTKICSANLIPSNNRQHFMLSPRWGASTNTSCHVGLGQLSSSYRGSATSMDLNMACAFTQMGCKYKHLMPCWTWSTKSTWPQATVWTWHKAHKRRNAYTLTHTDKTLNNFKSKHLSTLHLISSSHHSTKSLKQTNDFSLFFV